MNIDLRNIEIPVSEEYRSGTVNEPIHFFIDALSQSKQFDLLLGYFSTSALRVLSLGFAKFLANGGEMRLVINQFLQPQDKQAIIAGQVNEPQAFYGKRLSFLEVKDKLDEHGLHFFKCISWLVAMKKIKIVVISPKDTFGIAHYKSGVFKDNHNSVRFKGSCNFTATALLENLEEIDVKCSWKSTEAQAAIREQNDYFERIFSKKADFVDYIEIENADEVIIDKFGKSDVLELVREEKALIEKYKTKTTKNENLSERLNLLEKELQKIENEPRFPFEQGAREYQKQAYNNWVTNNFKGIFAMATGTGKTITALNCVLEEYRKSVDNVYHAIILVPTITLVEQWEKEAKSFNFQNVIKVSSKFDWKRELATTLSICKRIPSSFIIISTYASFVKDSFQKLLPKFPADTIFIADEGHNLASPKVLDSLHGFELAKRIGLSATPKRIYDEEGSQAMERFFNDNEPYTYSYSMEEAINNEVLCKYYYYPHIVTLTEDEFAEYYDITKKLTKYLTYNSKGSELSDIAQTLLLKRKRIIHKASNKLPKTIEILKNEFHKRKTLKYSFVYVPEGMSNEINETCEESDIENIKLINQFTREIAKIDDSITVNQFISGMTDRDEILNQFKSGKIQVMASMKCLDEGVDIPRAEYAVFCSSTGNPRQFIQRRGRILRKHTDKHLATIYDLVVVPDFENIEKESETFNVEKSLITKELERVMYFASLAINPYFTENVFKQVCDYYDLNLYTIQNELRTV